MHLAHPFHPAFTATGLWLLPLVWLGLPLYVFSGQYKGLTRYVGSVLFTSWRCVTAFSADCVGLRLVIAAPDAAAQLVVALASAHGFHRYCSLAAMYLSVCRANLGGHLFSWYLVLVLLVQLAAALRLANTRSVRVFDDGPALWNRSINGVSIQSPVTLEHCADGLDQVCWRFLIQNNRQRRIVDALQNPYSGSAGSLDGGDHNGRARIDALQPVSGGFRTDLADDKGPQLELLSALQVRVDRLARTMPPDPGVEAVKLVLLERSEPSLYTFTRS